MQYDRHDIKFSISQISEKSEQLQIFTAQIKFYFGPWKVGTRGMGNFVKGNCSLTEINGWL